jgi:YNFM family putative membrane transporter
MPVQTEPVTGAAVARGTPAFARICVALFIGGFATFALLYCVQPLFPLLGAYFGLSPAHASLALSTSTGTLAVAMPLLAVIGERWPRKRLMVGAMLAAAALTVAAAFAPRYGWLLAIDVLKGLALAGLPATAMAYLADEIEARSLGFAMSLYIAGTTIGGMGGRLISAWLAGAFSWRIALGGIGVLCLVLGVVFIRALPPSRRVVHISAPLAQVAREARAHLRDPVMLALFALAWVLMGVFVSVYNYLGYRLSGAPFQLSHAWVGNIFVIYLVGTVGAYLAGRLSDRFGRAPVLLAAAPLMLAGLAGMASTRLWLVVAGLAALTFGFFAGHTIASSWVGQRARAARASASALYLLFYYFGSTALGSYSGIELGAHGWLALLRQLGMLVAVALVLCIGLWLAPATATAAPGRRH